MGERRRATLSRRALNRALLDRQMLLRRRRLPVLEAIERLVALQAQVPADPYVALWARVDRFRPEVLAGPIEDRRAVRMTLFRGTLHLVTAGDAPSLRRLLQPVMERTVYGSSPLRRAIGTVHLDDLLSFFRAILEERPHTRSQLVAAARERWPGHDADALGYAMYLLPTVQVTPRGIWGRRGPSAFTTVERWLGQALSPDGDLDDLVLRYLRAFGPATPADVQAWCGLRGMREVLERLRARLRVVRDERGRELFDAPDAPLPDPETPAPVRFLPQYDNVLLGHADRSRIVSPDVPRWTEAGWGSVLVDGFTAARWRQDRPAEGRTTLRIEHVGPLAARQRDEMQEEGGRLLTFLEPDTDEREVRIKRA